MKSDFVWMDGQFVPTSEAKISVGAHCVHYGSAVFEGIRAYETKDGRTAIFRGKEHNDRLFLSAHIYRMHEKGKIPPKMQKLAAEKGWKIEVPYSKAEFFETMKETIRRNKFKSCYIRPVIYRGNGGLGVFPMMNDIQAFIMSWEWGAYLGVDALEKGVDVEVASWSRARPNTIPPMAKAAANYMGGQLQKMEAIINGYNEGIGLDANGLVSEGSGENIFLVKDGVIYTTPIGGSILGGITRDTIMTLAKEKGYEIKEQSFPREMMYVCDELFFTGTAAEVTPIRSVDDIQIGAGKRGPITEELQSAYLGLVHGEIEDKWGFLVYV